MTRRTVIEIGTLSAIGLVSGCSSLPSKSSSATTTTIQGFDIKIINRSENVDTVMINLESRPGEIVFADEIIVGPSSNKELDKVIPATDKKVEYSIQAKLDSGEESSRSFTVARDTHFMGIVITIQEGSDISIGKLLATE